MLRLIKVKILYFTLFLPLFLPKLAPSDSKYLCVKVIDGDSVWLRKGGSKFKARLLYVDAPEMAQCSLEGKPVGQWSWHWLRQNIEGKSLLGIDHGEDIYGRKLVELYDVNRESINLKMISNGMAIIYERSRFLNSNHKSQYALAFFKARKNRIGIWGTKGIYSPAIFRKKNGPLKKGHRYKK